MNSANALDVDGLTLRYGKKLALSDVSLCLAGRSILALIGPNGAGKSSLVKAICGRHQSLSGSIQINGVASTARAARQALGVAPQNAALYPQLTARENLICFARQAGMSRAAARTRCTGVLDLIGMSEHHDVRAAHMSGGMRQRVNIGAAIMHDPKLLVLDEPVSSLDPVGTAQVNQLIRRLKDEGFGVLLITHDMEQASMLADELLILSAGKIVARGAPSAIIEQYCGTRINLYLTTHDKDIAAAQGFHIHPDRPDCWHKQLAHQSILASEIPRLVEAGIGLERLSIVPSHIGDVLDLVIAAQFDGARNSVKYAPVESAQ